MTLFLGLHKSTDLELFGLFKTFGPLLLLLFHLHNICPSVGMLFIYPMNP
jgi:hypothetical protein